jgi:hypothetical protein
MVKLRLTAFYVKNLDSSVAKQHPLLQYGQGGNNGGVVTNGGGGNGGDGNYRIGLHVSPVDQSAVGSASPKHVFISGATGCIGRFLVAYLLQRTTHRITCIVRDPGRLQLPKSLKSAAR